MSQNKTITLIEMIVAIVIVGIISIGISKFVRQTIDIWRFLDFRNEISFEAKKALDWIIRDLKKIKDKNSINIAQSSHINFESSEDEDNNGVLDIIDINFLPAERTIIRSIDGGVTTSPLCREVENLTFSYFDGDGNPTTIRRLIRKIRVEITLQKGEENINFFSVVIPRNLYR
ncbi:MAG: hypothetical protein DRP76_02275 [Candidatus Omnitrophota bacterium]|nr:MAG: hypothetical protein DRP76_02275 [Candidatus Omnitrophota bacterium]